VKIFDFNDDFDNVQIVNYIMKKLSDYGFAEKHELIIYGDQIKFIKIQVSSYEDIIKIASINGVKSIDFFQEYSLPLNEFLGTDIKTALGKEYSDSETTIGIIDGGISDDNAYLKPYIVAREKYVNENYQNPNHATFIASTIQYGNKLNGIIASSPKRFKFVDILLYPTVILNLDLRIPLVKKS